MIFLNEQFYTSAEILNKVGGELRKKTFEYMRDTINLIPHPIKVSAGKGVTAYYPKMVVTLLRKILKARQRKLPYKQIRKELFNDIEEVHKKSDFLKRQYNAEKNVKLQLRDYLMSNDHPGNKGKIDYIIDKKEGLVIIETKLMNLKGEIRSAFQKWDGKSDDTLNRVRSKLDKIEELQATKRVLKGIKDTLNLT